MRGRGKNTLKRSLRNMASLEELRAKEQERLKAEREQKTNPRYQTLKGDTVSCTRPKDELFVLHINNSSYNFNRAQIGALQRRLINADKGIFPDSDIGRDQVNLFKPGNNLTLEINTLGSHSKIHLAQAEAKEINRVTQAVMRKVNP